LVERGAFAVRTRAKPAAERAAHLGRVVRLDVRLTENSINRMVAGCRRFSITINRASKRLVADLA
jgi:hypothetical protein